MEELSEPALVRQDFKTAVIDFEIANGVADVVDGDARIILKLKVVDALDVGIKAFMGGGENTSRVSPRRRGAAFGGTPGWFGRRAL